MHAQHDCPPAELRPRARRTLLVPTLLLALLAPLGDRAAHAAGSFSVSSCVTCSQRGPGAVAGNPQGSFVTAWTGATAASAPAVFGRFFRPDGTAREANLVLSAAAPVTGGDAAVAAEGSGFYVAAWSRKDGLNSEVWVQRFKRTTVPLGGPIQVSLDEPGTIRIDFAPAVAFLADGSMLVAWERFGPQIGSSPVLPVQVMARRFNFKNGRPFGPPQTISDSLVEDGRVALCATRGGAIGAAWTSLDRVVPFLPSLHGAVFRRLTPNGQPFGSEVPLAAPASAVGGVALACSAASFTAVWRSDQQPANGQGILARRIAANGALGDTFSISEAAGRVSSPAAYEDARGDTVVAWAVDDGARAQVVFRRFEGSGALGATTPASVLPLAGSLQPPAVGGIGKAGDFVVVWSGSEGLLGRRFSAAGVPLAARVPAADLDAAPTDER